MCFYIHLRPYVSGENVHTSMSHWGHLKVPQKGCRWKDDCKKPRAMQTFMINHHHLKNIISNFF